MVNLGDFVALSVREGCLVVGVANQGSSRLILQEPDAKVGIVRIWLDLRENFGTSLRIRRAYHLVGTMMIHFKTGVETRFGIRAYKRIDFGSSKLVKNSLKAWQIHLRMMKIIVSPSISGSFRMSSSTSLHDKELAKCPT